MPRYSPEKQSFTASSCSWENSSFSSDDAASQDLESTLWSRRTQSEFPQVSRQRHGCNRLPQSRSPTRTLHGHRKRRRFESWEPSGSTCTDAFQSISAWKYTELIQDNLTMALVDELHDDGCLLRERWNEIEDTLADMVAKRLQSVPQGPNPTFDSSYVIRGHRVIRCDDGFSKIFLEDCVAEIRKAWHGLRIRLVHASEIPCEAALAAVQDQRITSSTEDMEQTEENSFRWIVPRGAQVSDTAIQEIHKIPQAKETEVNAFGWIVPRGAQFSDTAIQKIKEFDLTKRKGNRPKFLVPDGLKTWRVALCGAGGIRIGQYTRLALRKEQPEEREVDHVEQSQMEEMNQIEEAKQFTEEKQTIMSQNTDEMIQEDKIPQAKETEVNSFGWIVPRGAQFSDTAIQKIKEFDLTKRKRNRQRFLVPDGLKTWRVTLCGADEIRIGQYTGPAFRKEQPEKTEEDHLKKSHQMEEMNQIEEAQQFTEEKQTNTE
ncbi:uncharacterized protein LOC119563037 isoform X2 [Drosophila subpulchrella]|uniref:uncharacterized protein LOC119563037 isoform X2 n=1 Tax=Drosophila subpulchrella TaxID=1486046 RepID=UPI0018A165ED|nr:uncharacterized protein LOC119563037 isoform X2 [Drosophila subpulchrella]